MSAARARRRLERRDESRLQSLSLFSGRLVAPALGLDAEGADWQRAGNVGGNVGAGATLAPRPEPSVRDGRTNQLKRRARLPWEAAQTKVRSGTGLLVLGIVP